MKTKLTITGIAFIIVNFMNAYSQNHNVGQLKFVLNGVDSTYINSTIGDFTGPDSVLIGYQWGNEPSVSKAIYANQNCVIKDFLFDNTHQSQANAAQEGAYLMISDYAFFTASLGDTSICSSHSMTWEPNMLVNSTDPQWDIIKKRLGDSTRPIFGFKSINPSAVIPSDSNDTYYSCLVINSPSLINYPLFRKPFASEYLYRTGDYNYKVVFNNPIQKKFLGYNYFISVNLRRYLGESELFPPGDTVLEIILPYTQHDSTKSYITFDGLPSNTIDSIYTTCNEYRGLKTRMIELTDTPTQHFYITKNMLPADGSPVTVTARFRCWGQEGTIPDFSNPMLSGPTTQIGTDIKKLGIYTIFRGGCPLAVDFVRICTPHSLETFEGQHDADIKEVIQDDIDSIAVYNTQQGTDLKVYRFNASTEGSVQNFDIERYVTKLVGNVFATTTFPVYPVLFDYYVQPPNRVILGGFVGNSINAPYIEKGEKDNPFRYRTLGWIAGSTQGTYEDILSLDQQLNSGYEIYYPYTSPEDQALGSHYSYIHFSPESLAVHPERIYELSWPDGDDSPTRSFQCFHQFQVWNLFHNEKVTGFQYCDNPWYFQAQNLTWWKIDTLTIKKIDFESSKININASGLNYKDLGTDVSFTVASFNSHGRPYTAEETRLLAYSAIGNGARGLIYDGVSYRHNEPFTRSAHFTPLDSLPIGSTEDRYEYLMRDDFGGDFFNLDNEKNPTNPLYFSKFDTVIFNFLNLNESKEDYAMANLGCHYNRIYAGRKSVRVELYKIHRLLMENSNTIMNLRLQAAFGKGIFKTYNQHPDSTIINGDSLINRYINVKYSCTKRNFLPVDYATGFIPSDSIDPVQDQYFDISLFKENGYDMNDRFYAFCQNRRTDPQIWRDMNNGFLFIPPDEPYNPAYQLKFYSDSELDYFCDFGGIDPHTLFMKDTAYWRRLYDKRLGHRVLELPINRLYRSVYQRMWGFFAYELSYNFNSENPETMPYWLKDVEKNRIRGLYLISDYNLYGVEHISVPLHPGQGKFICIEPYYQNIVSPTFPPKPPLDSSIVDTCEYLNSHTELYFKKVDTTDANNCLYEIYLHNKSNEFNLYVPVTVDFITKDGLDTTYGIPSNFQHIKYQKKSSYGHVWFPDSVITQENTFLGYYKPNCDSVKVVYKIGLQNCYKLDSIDLSCGICECCDSVAVSLQPITTQIQCRLFPHPSQRITLSTGENCDYYGMRVTGGFVPEDTQTITDLGIPFDTLAPIDLSTYNEWIADPFMFLPFGGEVTYCLHFSMLGKNGLELCQKDYCLSIDTEPIPNLIAPVGIISSDCYATVPAKRSIPLEEIHSGQMIIVDPNPTTGKANVRLNLENDLVGRLVLYTSTGELIQEIHNGKLAKGNSDYEINLSDYPSGMFIITIESDGMSYIKKFVKE